MRPSRASCKRYGIAVGSYAHNTHWWSNWSSSFKWRYASYQLRVGASAAFKGTVSKEVCVMLLNRPAWGADRTCTGFVLVEYPPATIPWCAGNNQVESQLRQKDDMGDALHYIDFHQLQIENKQYVSRIEERNDELLKVCMGVFG